LEVSTRGRERKKNKKIPQNREVLLPRGRFGDLKPAIKRQRRENFSVGEGGVVAGKRPMPRGKEYA